MVKLSMSNPLLTVDQVAGIFGVKSYTVREWLREGKLKGVKLNNNRWRVQHSDMQDFANKMYGS